MKREKERTCRLSWDPFHPPRTLFSPQYTIHTNHQPELEKFSLQYKLQVFGLLVKSSPYLRDKLSPVLWNQGVKFLFCRWQLFHKASSPIPSLLGLNFISHCPTASHLFSFQSLLPLFLSGWTSSNPHPPSIHPSIHTFNRIYQPPSLCQVPCWCLEHKDVTDSIWEAFLGQCRIQTSTQD